MFSSELSEKMLQHETELYIELTQNTSQLFVFAKGIPIENVITNAFLSYACDTSLVFVLSASIMEERHFIEAVQDLGGKATSVTTEISASERRERYSRGGLFFITSRIMVVDLLKNVIPIEKVTGMMVFRAHNVVESSQEAFILRLFRSKNKTGFIKAFSHNAASFLIGDSKINRVMRCMFLADVSLWPRYHASVKESLAVVDKQFGKSGSGVIEVHLKLTEEMEGIQSSLLNLITVSISNLKRMVPALNAEDVTPDTALTKGFEKIVAAYVDPIWDTISLKSKGILKDIKIFRQLLVDLTKCDPVTFYAKLCRETAEAAAFRYDWILTKSAENVIHLAKKRIFDSSMSSYVCNPKGGGGSPSFKPEVHPKWMALQEIMRNILITSEKYESETGSPFCARLKTMVLTEDIYTARLLRDYVCLGSDAAIGRQIKRCQQSKKHSVSIDIPRELQLVLCKIDKDRREALEQRRTIKKNGNGVIDNSSDDEFNLDRTTEIQVTLTQMERKYKDVEFLQTPFFIQPTKPPGEWDAFQVSEMLNKMEPDVIIIFDPSLALVRNIEVYRARVADIKKVTVYFLSFGNSVEEQIYLTSVQREKLAFEKLVLEKASMVVPLDREGKDDVNQDLQKDPIKASEAVTVNTLSKRSIKSETRQIILVDMREFRSELPSLLHKHGIDLEPITLDVGDYILTPEICVERKSISDLVGSLKSGRLFKQAQAMTRHYKKSVLLIEEEHQAQTVNAGLRYRNSLAHVMPKLQLLTLHFPKLQLVWSSGADFTTELFSELKKGREQPNPEIAVSILKEDTGLALSEYNPVTHAFLSKMPGVDATNIYKLLNKYESLQELLKLTQEELTEVLENSQASTAFYNGLHQHLNDLSEGSPEKQKTSESDSAKPSTIYRVDLALKAMKRK